MLKSTGILSEGLQDVGNFMADALRMEARMQGHRLTGRLERSIEAVIRKKLGEWEIDLLHEKYGTYQNTGIPASSIPYSPGSGARSSKFITALIRWVQLRGIAPGFAGAKRIAFAIATVQKREGMPTKGSYRFSNNGRRTGWIDHPASRQAQNIQRKTEKVYEGFFEAIFDEHIDALKQKFPGTIEKL